ncbi:siderophore-interacting protein [Georgenia yuyongxinii]|uniref:Siderophore-interacting protein n=1 Tax=Georgenia yuyongxinii TaxID=2589797 RepID=A0A5B8C1G0_9MICO|nr:siderophore-interacting protein [Georgenia yuyongxinii]QDC24364.1 siderophore-interacting protein [Georgenia yuyongxinii]
MLTSATQAAGVKDDRPAYRPFAVRVARLHRLSPHFTRVTLTGEDLRWFGTDRLDQRVKIVFPLHGRLCDIGATDPRTHLDGTWYARWRDLPPNERGPFRTYTVRDVRPEHRELDVDMVVHDDGGPAARWLAAAAPGEELIVVGPDVRSHESHVGIDWAPGTATELLLAGDETAAPAICAILETLPAGRRARAFIEVPDAEDFLDVALPAHAEITWLARGGRAHGELLVPAVREWIGANARVVEPARALGEQPLEDVDVDSEILWDSPVVRVLAHDLCGRSARCGSDFYAWFAGEAGIIRTLRRLLVSEAGVCRRRVAFMGYWRLGRAEAQ